MIYTFSSSILRELELLLKNLQIIILLSLLLGSGLTYAKKRYRQRNNKISVQSDLSFRNIKSKIKGEENVNIGFNLAGPLGISYSRNFSYVEIGVILSTNWDTVFKSGKTPESSSDIFVGFTFQGNVLANTRRARVVPSIGLEIGYLNRSYTTHIALANPYVSIEYFMSTRTSFGGRVKYPIHIFPFSIWNGVETDLSISYYFH